MFRNVSTTMIALAMEASTIRGALEARLKPCRYQLE